MVRCPTCQIEMSDGWQFDGTRAMQAIEQYILDWFAGNVPDEVLTHQKEVERLAMQARARAPEPRGRWKHG